MSAKQIFCKLDGYQSIGTGIYNITIKYLKEKEHLIKNNTGVVILNGQKLFITRYGDKEICLYCKQEGHKKSSCEKFNTVCTDCVERGHNKWTLATKIAEKGEENYVDASTISIKWSWTILRNENMIIGGHFYCDETWKLYCEKAWKAFYKNSYLIEFDE